MHTHDDGTGYRFCPRCGFKLDLRRLKAGEPERLVCGGCEFVFYLDPKVAVGTIIVDANGDVLLVRRAIEPGYGKWVFPGGYVDRGEQVQSAAIREAREESGLDIRLDRLIDVYSYAGGAPVVIVYSATMIGGEIACDEEGLEARFFAPDQIPWDDLAFRSITRRFEPSSPPGEIAPKASGRSADCSLVSARQPTRGAHVMTPNLAVVKPPTHETTSSGFAPAWLTSQMPPVYRSRYDEIQRLSAEIQGMDRMGRLLWEQGASLRDAVSEAFSALKTKPEWSDDGSCLAVRLDAKRRVLVHVAGTDGPIEKKGEGVAGAFRVLQEIAGQDDRTVLVTTGQRTLPPRERGETVSADAHDLLRRMGVNVLSCTTLFNICMLSLTDLNQARTYLELLHGQDGGTFKTKIEK